MNLGKGKDKAYFCVVCTDLINPLDYQQSFRTRKGYREHLSEVHDIA
jgi:hypothetical protein